LLFERVGEDGDEPGGGKVRGVYLLFSEVGVEVGQDYIYQAIELVEVEFELGEFYVE
jgi:hypothetical protein